MARRLLVFAIAMASAASAAAGERADRVPGPDTLALLMQDEQVAGGSPAAGEFDMRGASQISWAQTDLAGFDRLDAAPADLPAGLAYADAPTPIFAASATDETTAAFAGLYAVADAMTNHARPVRPRTLGASVILRLDGDAESPSLSLGGAAAVLNLIPRN